jgi:hypothetical protein
MAQPKTGIASSGDTALSQGQAAVQTWTGVSISTEIQSRTLATAYRQWLLIKPTRQPRLKDMIAAASNPADDMLLNLRIGDDYIVVSQSESYIRREDLPPPSRRSIDIRLNSRQSGARVDRSDIETSIGFERQFRTVLCKFRVAIQKY